MNLPEKLSLPEFSADARRRFVIAGVLLGSAILAVIAVYEPDWLPLIPLGLAAALAAAALVRWPLLGMLVLPPASLFVPLELSTGTQTSLNITILLVVGLFAVDAMAVVAVRRVLRLDVDDPLWLLIIFNVIAVAALLNGQLPWLAIATERASLAAQLGGLGIYAISTLAYLLGQHHLAERRWLQWFIVIYVASGGLYFLLRLLPVSGLAARIVANGSDDAMFWVWTSAIAAGQALFNNSLDWRLRAAAGAVVLVQLVISLGVSRSWTSGWMPVLVGLAAMLAIAYPRYAYGLTILPFLLAALNWEVVLTELVTFSNDQYSYLTRLEAWNIVLEIVKVNPVLGLGPANYRFYTPLFPILGWYVRFNSHSQYVDLIAQVGLLGTGVILAFFVRQFTGLWQSLQRVTDDFERAFLFSALGGLSGMLFAGFLGDWFLPFVYNIGFKGMRSSLAGWIFLGAATVIWRKYRAAGHGR